MLARAPKKPRCASPVVAIGLDATEPALLERWLAAGELPACRRLRAAGAYGRLKNYRHHKAEPTWTTVLTGAWPHETGYWGRIRYDAAGPDAREFDPALGEKGTYAFDAYPPLHALGPRRRVLVFDVPQSDVEPRTAGLQVFAYGAQSPRRGSGSVPEALLDEILTRHGPHPTLHDDTEGPYRADRLEALRRNLDVGIERRTAVLLDLMGRESFDFVLTTYCEPHAVGHCFWHCSGEHPLAPFLGGARRDEMLAVHEHIDASIGAVAEAAGPEATIAVYSPYGMTANASDVSSTLFLPELLYRSAMPGRAAIAPGGSTPVPPPRLDWPNHWSHEVWGLVCAQGRADLKSPSAQAAAGDRLAWQPANWFKPVWPRMPAFALPSYSDGYVRVNVEGRERGGLVDPGDFARVLDDVERMLRSVRDARTGRPVVADLERTRTDPMRPDPGGPPADLVVDWSPDAVTDAVEADGLGRIGPVPYFRTGGHTTDGFLLIAGPGIPGGVTLEPGEVVDIAPTLLRRLAEPVPERMRGRDLLARLAPGQYANS